MLAIIPLFAVYFLWFCPTFCIMLYINFEVVRYVLTTILSLYMWFECRMSFVISSFCLVPVCLDVSIRLLILRGCHALASFLVENMQMGVMCVGLYFVVLQDMDCCVDPLILSLASFTSLCATSPFELSDLVLMCV